MIDLDKNKEICYLGKFWAPNMPDRKFSGTLTFSKESQISLKITGYIETADDFAPSSSCEVKQLYGSVEEIGKVTLLDCLSNGGRTNLRQSESHFIKHYMVSYAILGIHCLKDDTIFTGISFHFGGLNNFCVLHPNEYFIADNTTQIDCTIDDNIVIKLQQGLKDAFDLSMAMFACGSKYETKLVEELRQKTENMMLSKPYYFFHIKGNSQTAGNYIHLQYDIEKLFSIFLFKKIYSLCCFLKAGNKEYQLINAFSLKEKTDENKILPMAYLPVCLNNVRDKFSEILKNWKEILQFDLINSFITDKLYHNSGAGLQQYSILIALIGAWQSKKDGDYKNRYKNFLAENLLPEDDIFNEEITIKLRQILGDSKTLDEIAEDIGEIRNTILHIDQLSPTCQKLKKYGHIVKNEIHIANLCEILFIIVIKAIYRKLGIEQSEDQKRGLLRQCLNWSSVPL